MNSDEKLAQWAALFVNSVNAEEAGKVPETQAVVTPRVDYPGISAEAGDLLRSVDSGGVPAFVTSRLKHLAEENGVAVEDGWTPNEIIDALRSRVLRGSSIP